MNVTSNCFVVSVQTKVIYVLNNGYTRLQYKLIYKALKVELLKKKGKYTMMNRIVSGVLLGFLLIQISHAATQLALPKMEPELAVTEKASLGSRDSNTGLAVGSKVPAFSVTTHDGKPFALSDLLKIGDTLVVFYRGGWCPYCNIQVRQLTQAWPEFRKRNITPILISVDKTDAATLSQRSYEIPFPVLSDPDLKAHTAFNVIMDVDDATYERYKSYGIDLEQWSGKNHHKIAVSSAYIIGSDGLVKWVHTSLDYKTRPSIAQFLAVLDSER